MDVSSTMQVITAYAVGVGFKIVGAIVFWLLGRWLIALAVRLVSSALERQKVDPTLLRYLGTIISVTLNIILVVAILGYFGVETTSFAAIVAAAGIAIGMAWSDLLSNFAAGAFIMVLRPFKVGDFITAGGVTGTVKEIGLFVTAIVTLDNVLNLVGNDKDFLRYDSKFFDQSVPSRRFERAACAFRGSQRSDQTAQRAGSLKSPTFCLTRRRTWKFLNSISTVRCSPCVPTATTIITGRFTSTPTK